MKNKYRKTICALMIGISLCSASIVHAATQYPPEGGQWNYGVGVLGSYSDYFHSQRYHGSTVNHKGTRYSAEAKAGSWSQALARGVYSGCAFYYNI